MRKTNSRNNAHRVRFCVFERRKLGTTRFVLSKTTYRDLSKQVPKEHTSYNRSWTLRSYRSGVLYFQIGRELLPVTVHLHFYASPDNSVGLRGSTLTACQTKMRKSDNVVRTMSQTSAGMVRVNPTNCCGVLQKHGHIIYDP